MEGCCKVLLEPSLLQAEEPQLSQPVLLGVVLKPSDYLYGPPLHPLQQLHILLVLGAAELDAVLWEGSHESRIEKQDATQSTVDLLGWEHTLLSPVEPFIK